MSFESPKMDLPLTPEIQSLFFQLESKDNQIRHLQAEIRRLTGGADLQVDCTADQDVLIASAFASVQKDIQNLVTTWYEIDGIPPRIESFTSTAAEFFTSWHSKLGKKNMINRVRGIIFALLYQDMMKDPYFGIRTTDPTVEAGLAMFERQVANGAGKRPEYAADVTTWRRYTMKLLNLVELESEVRENVLEHAHVLRHIWTLMKLFLNPPLDQAHSSQRKQQVYKEILALYTKMSRIIISLRNLKDTYKVEMPGPILYDREMFEPRGSEREDMSIKTPSPIAFVIFGALVKYSGVDGRKIGVLKRAHVILGD